MKKTLLFFSILAITKLASAQFVAGNLVVSRVGNGSTTLSASTAPVSLLEYTSVGVSQATSVSTTALNSSNISIAGNSLDGQLSLSSINNFLVFGGYAVPSGESSTNLGVTAVSMTAGAGVSGGSGYTTSPIVTISAPNLPGGIQATAGSQITGGVVTNVYINIAGSGYTSAPTVTFSGGGGGSGAVAGTVSTLAYWQGFSSNKMIARIDANKNVDYTTSFLSSSSSSNGSVKGAVSYDGSSFYLNGGARLEYVTFGQTTAATSIFSVGARSISAQGNKLSFLQGYNTPTLRFTDTALPTTTSTATAVPGITTNLNSFGYYFFDGDATLGYNGTVYDLLYIADGFNGLQKFYYNGSTWVAAGYYTGASSALYSLTGQTVSGVPVLYAVTGGNNSNNSLVAITDGSGRTGSISTTAPTFVTLATAGANYGFRGVAFAPGSAINLVLPIKLSSFKGEAQGNNNRLTWATSSEVNFKEFVVEKSTDGKNFATVGNPVSSKNVATGSSYSFIDNNAVNGTVYYRLKSVDNDGTFEYSSVVAIKSSISQNSSVVIYPNPTTGPVTVQHSTGLDNGTISVTDLSGREIKVFNIAKNSTSTLIDLSELKTGVYFVNVINGEKSIIKLIKN